MCTRFNQVHHVPAPASGTGRVVDAKVFNCIYEYFTDHSWRQQACSPTKELKPGGGSSNRTVARIKCRTFQQTSWRNHVEVDVIGKLDTGEKPMNQAKAACRAQ
ncbi:hypothetical protein [Streptomyces sp. NBC_01438]|uniref:hypothetical protein n=1 Tax=Streptomyces sp. NBC_01438 TaxID=2903866 RepID=UPI00324E264E